MLDSRAQAVTSAEVEREMCSTRWIAETKESMAVTLAEVERSSTSDLRSMGCRSG